MQAGWGVRRPTSRRHLPLEAKQAAQAVECDKCAVPSLSHMAHTWRQHIGFACGSWNVNLLAWFYFQHVARKATGHCRTAHRLTGRAARQRPPEPPTRESDSLAGVRGADAGSTKEAGSTIHTSVPLHHLTLSA